MIRGVKIRVSHFDSPLPPSIDAGDASGSADAQPLGQCRDDFNLVVAWSECSWRVLSVMNGPEMGLWKKATIQLYSLE